MDRLKRMQFANDVDDEYDEHLIGEVLRREKTATVCRADEYHLPYGEYDDGNWQVGDLVEIYDRKARLRCIVRVTEVYNVRFGDIPEKLWRDEACESAEHFREAHREVWPDYDLTPDFELTATHFELVEVVNP